MIARRVVVLLSTCRLKGVKEDKEIDRAEKIEVIQVSMRRSNL